MASGKKFLPSKKSFLEDGENYSVTRGLRWQALSLRKRMLLSVSSSSSQ
jgi:hypothetical protein